MKQNPFISPYASEHRKRKLIIALFFLVVMTLGVIYMICKQTSEPPQKTDTVYLRQQMMQALWQEDYAKVHQLYTEEAHGDPNDNSLANTNFLELVYLNDLASEWEDMESHTKECHPYWGGEIHELNLSPHFVSSWLNDENLRLFVQWQRDQFEAFEERTKDFSYLNCYYVVLEGFDPSAKSIGTLREMTDKEKAACAGYEEAHRAEMEERYWQSEQYRIKSEEYQKQKAQEEKEKREKERQEAEARKKWNQQHRPKHHTSSRYDYSNRDYDSPYEMYIDNPEEYEDLDDAYDAYYDEYGDYGDDE